MKVFIRAQKITRRKRLCVWCGLMIYIAPIATCFISHKIIHVHSNVIWDWQYYMEYSHIQTAYGNIMQNICQSHITLLWNWIMLCPTWREEGAKRIVFVQYPHHHHRCLECNNLMMDRGSYVRDVDWWVILHQLEHVSYPITSFISIKMLCGTGINYVEYSHIQAAYGNIR